MKWGENVITGAEVLCPWGCMMPLSVPGPSCQTNVLRLMGSSNRAFHQSPVIANTVPSVWLCIFGLHVITSACTALGFLLFCRLNVIWGAAWRALNIASSYICPCTTLFINLLLAELLITSYMDLYTCVKLNYKKFTVFRWIHISVECLTDNVWG